MQVQDLDQQDDVEDEEEQGGLDEEKRLEPWRWGNC